MIPRRGSYAEGFAPRDFRPIYPELWQGCVGAWAPCLGPTGVTLRDWSGRQNHGTLTNFTVANAWAVSGGNYALTFDASDDKVTGAMVSVPTGDVTLSAWVNINTHREYNGVFGPSSAYQTGMTMYLQSGAGTGVAFGVLAAGGYAEVQATRLPSTGAWHHVCGVRIGTAQLAVYVNGVLQAVGNTVGGGTPSGALTFPTEYVIGKLAGTFGASDQFGGSMDDIAIFNRALTPNEIRLRASGRGIAYTPAPRRRVFASAAFNRRRRVICAGGGW